MVSGKFLYCFYLPLDTVKRSLIVGKKEIFFIFKFENATVTCWHSVLISTCIFKNTLYISIKLHQLFEIYKKKKWQCPVLLFYTHINIGHTFYLGMCLQGDYNFWNIDLTFIKEIVRFKENRIFCNIADLNDSLCEYIRWTKFWWSIK